jgi:arsenate reductase (glutaredoxin)
MADLTLWHNPRCSKSRAAKAILDDALVAYVERRYLDEPPSADELGAVCIALGKEPWEIARMGEDAAKTLKLADLPHEQHLWLEVMAANPILIERPILVTVDGRAALGRPPEAIEVLLPSGQARPPYDPQA